MYIQNNVRGMGVKDAQSRINTHRIHVTNKIIQKQYSKYSRLMNTRALSGSSSLHSLERSVTAIFSFFLFGSFKCR